MHGYADHEHNDFLRESLQGRLDYANIMTEEIKDSAKNPMLVCIYGVKTLMVSKDSLYYPCVLPICTVILAKLINAAKSLIDTSLDYSWYRLINIVW